MPSIPNYETKEFIAAGGTWDIALNQSTMCQEYYIYSAGTITLSSSWSVAPEGTPYDGMKCVFYYSAKCNLDGNTIDIFKSELTQGQALSDCIIVTRYDGNLGDWVTQVFASDNDLPQDYDGVNSFALTDTGGTETLVAGIDKKFQRITGRGIKLLGSWVWTFGGSPIEGDEFVIHFNAYTIDLNGNDITIGGNILSQLQATTGNTIVFCVFDGSDWICTAVDGAGSTDSFRVMGSSTDASPDFLDAKVKNSIEIDGDKLQLDGDSAAPGNNYTYGTSNAGAKGWIAPVKVYKAYLTQTGTDDPVATVVYNTIGSIVWTRDSSGLYLGTLLNSFTVGKTFVTLNCQGKSGEFDIYAIASPATISTVAINTERAASPDDDVLWDTTTISIEVYP